jgi:NADPH:quinone reductase-like Zn-dependent oxidoreductase
MVIAADNVVKIPENVSYAEASFLSCAIGTVLNAIRDVGHVGPGDDVLVTGAGGGLGVHALQLCRSFGAHVIAATTSSGKADRLKEMGAHDVVVAEDGAFSEGVKSVTGGLGASVVIDNVGGKLFHEIRQSLARQGRYVMVGELSGSHISLNLAQLFLRGINLLSVMSTARWQLQDTVDLVASGHVRPILSETYPLEKVADAHEALADRQSFGRVALTID